MHRPELQEFQKAAVDRIVERLQDRKGSRRFLLADEVGLGKTLVAKGVIDELRNGKRHTGLTVVYICSNSEIADQNRTKLSEGADTPDPGRLTLLSLQSRKIGQQRKNRQLQVFAFTPGTSLQVEHGTGIAKERRLILHLVRRIWRKQEHRPRWREFFRCTSGEENWRRDASIRKLKSDFGGVVARDFLRQLKAQWESQQITLLDLQTGRTAESPRSLKECLEESVEAFRHDGGKSSAVRKNRNRVIGELRRGLASVSLEYLKPDLTLLDEFQRFSHILAESRDSNSIVGKLFSRGSGAILILSATPYRMYTLAQETEDHHKGFMETLAFLRKEAPDGSGLKEIQDNLKRFRDRLVQAKWKDGDDQDLLDLRGRLEAQLKEVMCRTERNWYLTDSTKGVEEIARDGLPPEAIELVDYIQLRQFLLNQRVGDWNITDFWKSSPSIFSFMDRQYKLISRIRRSHVSLPSRLLRPATALSAVGAENAKYRALHDKVFGSVDGKKGAWKYLWIKPTYTYHRDGFYRGYEPTKFLVFSHWRFVPKTIAVLTSMDAARLMGRARRRRKTQPLQFRKKVSFYPFDVCYPSLALARCINQLELRRSFSDEPTPAQVFSAARNKLKKLLHDKGVQPSPTRQMPLWQIMARIEGKSETDRVRAAFDVLRRRQGNDPLDHLPQHVKQYLNWMDSNETVSISPEWLDRLTAIALYSPAQCVLRSMESVFGEADEATWPQVLEFCFGPLRNYFNKTLVQTVIRRHGSAKSYTERVLSYCCDAHFQAVTDEYAYLVKHVLQRDMPAKFLTHLGSAMGMWTGQPGVNDRTETGRLSPKSRPFPTHFALSFGDDVADEAREAGGKARKSAVREAFNSPFWPFVLATTSVGQEGLDFHLYCRDIVHWNLPSNPVDLEQREGRINRYDGLAIRRNVGLDLPLGAIAVSRTENLWAAAFRTLTGGLVRNGRFKHGLYPHWIYQCSKKGPVPADRAIVRRHIPFYRGSRDRRRYLELKNALAIYRLVFGQPRQQDILEHVVGLQAGTDPMEINRALAKYMINISPFDPKYAEQRARKEAERILADPTGLEVVLDEVRDQMTEVPKAIQEELGHPLDELCEFLRGSVQEGATQRRTEALGALLYFLDPYDAVHDRHGTLGYLDDVEAIRRAHSAVFGSRDHARGKAEPAREAQATQQP